MLAVMLFPLLAVLATSGPVPQRACVTEAVPTAVETQVVFEFNDRVERYVAVHRAVEQSLSLPRMFDEAEDMFEAMEAMRSGIRDARPDARRGDIFTDALAALVRRRLSHALVACNERVEDVLAFINEERLPGARRPQLNRRFPWELGSAMWPTLLAALPPLPDELQYRFADRDLVLIDMHADMVVDILVNALPAPRRDMTLLEAGRTWTAGP